MDPVVHIPLRIRMNYQILGHSNPQKDAKKLNIMRKTYKKTWKNRKSLPNPEESWYSWASIWLFGHPLVLFGDITSQLAQLAALVIMNFWAFFKGSKYVEATTFITIKSSYHFTSCYVHLCTNRIIYVPIAGDLSSKPALNSTWLFSTKNLVSTARPGRSPLICSPEKMMTDFLHLELTKGYHFNGTMLANRRGALVAKAF